jgi:antitoxin VapB
MEKVPEPEPGPYAADWAWLDKVTRPLDEDFLQAVLEEVPQQERPELDEFFR